MKWREKSAKWKVENEEPRMRRSWDIRGKRGLGKLREHFAIFPRISDSSAGNRQKEPRRTESLKVNRELR
jgi:predicted DNA-binding WGR domain protein